MNIKAFISNTAIVGVGVIAPLGELSTHNRTFSKTLQEYQLPGNESISLAVFNDVVPTSEVLSVISDAVYSMIVQSVTRTVGNYDATLFIQAISANIGITGLQIGELVLADGQKGVEYMFFEIIRSGAPNDHIELWYSDDKMRADYDLIEYTV
ncbi:MAG: hypothetical protein KAG66_17055, partial [Methylococcales bacterium]|nr:hypothetical protein [Methylococcales bacterium]